MQVNYNNFEKFDIIYYIIIYFYVYIKYAKIVFLHRNK